VHSVASLYAFWTNTTKTAEKLAGSSFVSFQAIRPRTLREPTVTYAAVTVNTLILSHFAIRRRDPDTTKEKAAMMPMRILSGLTAAKMAMPATGRAQAIIVAIMEVKRSIVVPLI
jgi:hypothetical protein